MILYYFGFTCKGGHALKPDYPAESISLAVNLGPNRTRLMLL